MPAFSRKLPGEVRWQTGPGVVLRRAREVTATSMTWQSGQSLLETASPASCALISLLAPALVHRLRAPPLFAASESSCRSAVRRWHTHKPSSCNCASRQLRTLGWNRSRTAPSKSPSFSVCFTTGLRFGGRRSEGDVRFGGRMRSASGGGGGGAAAAAATGGGAPVPSATTTTTTGQDGLTTGSTILLPATPSVS